MHIKLIMLPFIIAKKLSLLKALKHKRPHTHDAPLNGKQLQLLTTYDPNAAISQARDLLEKLQNNALAKNGLTWL